MVMAVMLLIMPQPKLEQTTIVLLAAVGLVVALPMPGAVTYNTGGLTSTWPTAA
jgi:hypothetical protein